MIASTIYIQRWFRKWKNRNMWFDVIRRAKDAAQKIQKLARQKLIGDSMRQYFKIRMNLKYFDVLKIKLHTHSQIVIAYHWRRYKKAKDKKIALLKALEAEKLAKKKKKTNGKPTKNATYKSKTVGKVGSKGAKTTAKSSSKASGETTPKLKSYATDILSSQQPKDVDDDEDEQEK